MNRRCFLKTAVSQPEAEAVDRQADMEGLSRSAYFRVALARDIERQSYALSLVALRAELQRVGGADAGEGVLAVVEPTLTELLHLVRLLATQAQPQAAARVTAGINQQYPDRRIK